MAKKCKDCGGEEIKRQENPEVKRSDGIFTYRFVKEGVSIDARSLEEAQRILDEMKRDA